MRFLAATFVLLAVSTVAEAQTRIDTNFGKLPSAGGRSLRQMGNAMNGRIGATATGQVFTTQGAPSMLNNFSFWLTAGSDGCESACPSDLQFKGYVFAWDLETKRAVGPAVYESDVRLAPTAAAGTLEYRFDTGNLRLTPNQVYVAFLSAGAVLQSDGITYTPGPNGSTQSNGWQHVERATQMSVSDGRISQGLDPEGRRAYTGGGIVSTTIYNMYAAPQGSGSDIMAGRTVFLPSSIFSGGTEWEEQYSEPTMRQDAAFTADFTDIETTVTPEPATLFLLGSGLAGIAALKRRRRERRNTSSEA